MGGGEDRNDRNVRNTPYQYLPSRVEQASIETYAVKTRSLPPGGKSMLDTLGATGNTCIQTCVCVFSPGVCGVYLRVFVHQLTL